MPSDTLDAVIRQLFAIHVLLRPGRYGAAGEDRAPTIHEFDLLLDCCMQLLEHAGVRAKPQNEADVDPNIVYLDDKLILWQQRSQLRSGETE